MSNARTLASLIDGSNIVVPSGYGLDFSANANASGMTSEVLDDYEEGEVIDALRIATTFIDTSATGNWPHNYKYVKVGNVVSISFLLNTAGNDYGQTGAITVRLPYVISSSAGRSEIWGKGYYAFGWTDFLYSFTEGNSVLEIKTTAPSVKNSTNSTHQIFLMYNGTYLTD